MNNLANDSGNVFFLWAKRNLYGLPWVSRLWCWENRLGTAGPHFGSVASTIWYICLWCHLITLNAVITSVWMFDFQAYFVQWVCLFDCVPQITWSVDYILLGVWILGLQDMAISQVTGSEAPIEPLLYLPLSELWFPRINHTWWHLGKSYRYSKSSPNFSFSSQMIFVSSILQTWSQHKSDGCYYYLVFTFFLEKLGKTQFECLQSKLNVLAWFKELLKSFLQRSLEMTGFLINWKWAQLLSQEEGLRVLHESFVLFKKIGCFLFSDKKWSQLPNLWQLKLKVLINLYYQASAPHHNILWMS